MTANQIAAASNEITKEHYERSDAISADANTINKEHLERMDAINARRNDLEQQSINNERWYKEQMLAIEQQYNSSRISLNEYEMKKKDAETQYTINKTSIEALLATNDSERTNELSRHNQAEERLKSESNKISAESVANDYALTNKRLEYQKHQWDTENFFTFDKLRLSREQFEVDRDVKYGNLNLGFLAESRYQTMLGFERRKVDLAEKQFEWSKSQIISSNFLNYTKGISEIGSMATKLLLGGIRF